MNLLQELKTLAKYILLYIGAATVFVDVFHSQIDPQSIGEHVEAIVAGGPDHRRHTCPYPDRDRHFRLDFGLHKKKQIARAGCTSHEKSTLKHLSGFASRGVGWRNSRNPRNPQIPEIPEIPELGSPNYPIFDPHGNYRGSCRVTAVAVGTSSTSMGT
jgi:hypothetical protein